ncbi:hypothetical protein GCM10010280_11030 [Streptomyces pilosus]|uniref:Uncharacterized protein n=1 Tax=Streptomyces pilosus TaxID=28893 RepID=A0A918BGC4_9ACTN|nr:hypothetical protein GCM10010280_11030 [Streptomyces pilosus]
MGTGRDTSEPTDATGAPVVSVISSARLPDASPSGAVMRTRTRAAPRAYTRTPDQANGMAAGASRGTVPEVRKSALCRAASSRAGCRP